MGNSEIDKLKSQLGMGARANRYKVIINGVLGGPSGDFVNTFAKSSSVPGRDFAEIEMWNQGRLVVIAGDTSFAGTWSVTFLDNEHHTLRKQFIAWMEGIDSALNHSSLAGDHSAYMTTGELHQLSTISGGKTVGYKFEDVWPKSISESAMSDDAQDIVEFTVEFNYSTWAVS